VLAEFKEDLTEFYQLPQDDFKLKAFNLLKFEPKTFMESSFSRTQSTKDYAELHFSFWDKIHK
jgi:hypothetical protein